MPWTVEGTAEAWVGSADGNGAGWAGCYNLESAGSQAPGLDVRACRRRSGIPVKGGQHVPTVVSRHLSCM